MPVLYGLGDMPQFLAGKKGFIKWDSAHE
jgi:hypothetical protein